MTDDKVDYLVTGAGGAVGGVSNTVAELLIASGATVRAMVHHDDERAAALRTRGAHVVVGDLTEPRDVVHAMTGARRVFFNMSVTESYLTAATTVCAAGREIGAIETIVNMSQMTVSQMTLTSTGESHQQRLHWLVEQVMDWSGLPVTHIRPTVFIDNPIFTTLSAESVRDHHTLALPLGNARTSPIAAADVARVVAALLTRPAEYSRHVYEPTGPEVLDLAGLADRFAVGLGYPVTGSDIPYDEWVTRYLEPAHLPSHVAQHIATVARLHHEDWYDLLTNDVEEVTGQPAMRIDRYIAEHREKFDAQHPTTTASALFRTR